MSDINKIETLVILLRATNKKSNKYLAKRILEAEYMENKKELKNVRFMCKKLLDTINPESTTEHELKDKLIEYLANTKEEIRKER